MLIRLDLISNEKQSSSIYERFFVEENEFLELPCKNVIEPEIKKNEINGTKTFKAFNNDASRQGKYCIEYLLESDSTLYLRCNSWLYIV